MADFLGLHTSIDFDPATATPEEFMKEARGMLVDATCYTDKSSQFNALCMADTLASMATAASMLEQNLCGHGIRGWCPNCHHAMRNGMGPQ